ncbi:MAG: GNAT family N-acetyltransferase [Sporichthyaceae bacterium]
MPPDLPDEPIEIAAGRIQLRPWEHRLAPELLAAFADPEYRRWGLPAPEPTLEGVHQWIDGRDRAWRAGERLSFAVQDITTAALLGEVGLKGFDVWPSAAEVGYWVAPAARRRGVATAAVRTLSRWAFGALDLHRLRLDHAVGNTASCVVAARCGFAVEGIARSAQPLGDGTWSDVETHARLAADPPCSIEGAAP